MNIQIQLCGLCILVLIYIFYKSHRTLQLYSEKVFFRTLCIMIISVLLDISSIVAIYYRQSLPDALLTFVCKTYIVSLVWAAYSAFGYVFSDIYTQERHRKFTWILAVLALGTSSVTYFLPIYIYEDGSNVYTYGAATIWVYFLVGISIIATLVSTCVFRKKQNRRRGFAIIIWMVIWIISALIQFFNKEILLVGFASSIGVLILFAIMENPESNLDRRLGCFNSYALTIYLKQLYESKKKFSILEISFEDLNHMEEQSMDDYEIMKQILHLIAPYRDILAFKNNIAGLVLISEKPECLQQAGEKILARFADLDIFQKETMFILVTRTDCFENMDGLYRFLSFVRTEYSNETGCLFHVDDTMITEYKEQHWIRQEISAALTEDRVEVFLQPIYSNHSLQFTSAEALVRIRKKDGELLAPGLFIPVAEDSGQILELGERVLEKVCQFLKESDAVKLGIHYIEVNLSVIQCEKKDLAERMIRMVEKYGIDPGLINLEVTETASVSARAILLENMKRLIDYGFTFSLDDFGKGHSNLMYVVEMPVSIVKLDYDLSKAFFTSEKAKNVVRAVIGMSHGMDLKIVSEGIETQEEIDAMREEGSDYIQGYYYSKPLPMEEFLGFLQKNRM